MCMTNNKSAASASKTKSSKEKLHPYKILSEKAVTNLPKYQYNGIDRSLVYKYILSPLARFLVNTCTPSTLAPNAITLIGLGLMFVSYLNIHYHCPTLEDCGIHNEDIPNSIFLLNGIVILMYQTLDNMDGIQARKTQSSSPLGLLFDHGCDAINSIFGSVTWICALGLIPQSSHYILIWLMVFAPMLVFYISTWEEYYTHKLDLPLINGPSEGLILFATMNITSWWFGRSVWHGTEVYDLVSTYAPDFLLDYAADLSTMTGISFSVQNYNILVVAFTLSTAREVFTKIIAVVRAYGAKSLKNLAPMIVLMVWSFLIISCDYEIFERNQKCCFHLAALLFVEMVTNLMLDHTTGEIYNPFRNTLVPLFLLHFVSADGFFGPDQVDLCIWIYTGVMFVYLAGKTKLVISEICDLLGIWCFDIVTPRKKEKVM
jgi:ethanolaminephosphotransferase